MNGKFSACVLELEIIHFFMRRKFSKSPATKVINNYHKLKIDLELI